MSVNVDLIAREVLKLQSGKSKDVFVLVRLVKQNYEKTYPFRGSIVRYLSENNDFDLNKKGAGKSEVRINANSDLRNINLEGSPEKMKIDKGSDKVVSEWDVEEGDFQTSRYKNGYKYTVKENGSYKYYGWTEEDGAGGGGGGDEGVLDEKAFQKVVGLEYAGKKKEIFNLLESFH